MTANSARTRSATDRRLPRAVAAAIATFVVAASAVVGAGPASAVTPVDLTVAASGNGVVRIGSTASATVTLTNRSLTQHPAGTVAIAIGREPITDRATLDAWLSGDDVPFESDETPTLATEPVDAGVASSVAVPLPVDDLRDRAVGVYAIESRYRVADQTDLARSVIVLTDGVSHGTITVVTPITAPPTGRGLLTSTELADLTATEGALTAQLDATLGTGAVLAVDPAILAAIRVLGTTAPASATAWLERLLAASNPKLTLAFGDSDPAVQAAAGLDAPLDLLGLNAYVAADGLVTPTPSATPGVSEASVEPTDEPTAEPTPAGPVLPTLDELVALPGADTDVFWPSTATARLLEQANDRDQRVLIPSSHLTSATGAVTASRADVTGATALVYDSELSATLETIAITENVDRRTAALIEASAQAAITADEDGTLVILDRDTMLRAGAGVAVTALLDAPFLTDVGLDGLHGTPVEAALDESVDTVGQERVQDRGDTLRTLLGSEDDIARIATLLDDPTLLTGRFRAEMLQLTAVRWASTPVSWTRAVIAHREAVEATADAVGILPLREVQVLGSSVGLPITIRNDLPYPITAQIIAQPDDLRLTVKRVNDVTAQASANSSVRIPVTSRIGNGVVDVSFVLQSADGTRIGDEQIVTLNVRAEWEAIGLVIMAALVGSLFGVGIIRTVLRRRRARRQGDGADAAGAPEGNDG